VQIFISYRRADTLGTAGRVVDHLALRFGRDSVRIDIDDIPFGVDFRSHVRQMIVGADIVLALVGPGWLGKSDEAQKT